MSDYLPDNNYGEYFEKLNSRLNSNEVSGVSPTIPAQNKGKRYKRNTVFKRRALAGIVCFGLIGVIIAISVNSANKKPQPTQKPVAENEAQAEALPELTLITYSEAESVEEIPATNDAKNVIIVRLSDKKIIAGRDYNSRIYPASTLKIMTLLTAVDLIEDFDDTFTMSLEITDPLFTADASVAGFLNGEEVTMTDLIYGMILPSGADGAMGLAVKLAGSEEAFVALMNQKAEKLGLKNTHFTNVTGLFDENNYSSAHDMALILNYALENELCREVLSTYQYTTRSTTQNPNGIKLSSTLFNYMYGTEPETATILGGKTGYVTEAGYCVASFGENISKTEEYIVVTMGNSSKWPAFHGQIALYKQFAK